MTAGVRALDVRPPVAARRRRPCRRACSWASQASTSASSWRWRLARASVDLPQPGGLALWLGRVTGLLAEVLVLGQLLLSARVPLLERAAGQDQLLRWHRTLAPAALVCVLLHPLLLAGVLLGLRRRRPLVRAVDHGPLLPRCQRRRRPVPDHGRRLRAAGSGPGCRTRAGTSCTSRRTPPWRWPSATSCRPAARCSTAPSSGSGGSPSSWSSSRRSCCSGCCFRP